MAAWAALKPPSRQMRHMAVQASEHRSRCPVLPLMAYRAATGIMATQGDPPLQPGGIGQLLQRASTHRLFGNAGVVLHCAEDGLGYPPAADGGNLPPCHASELRHCQPRGSQSDAAGAASPAEVEEMDE
eukprot:Skav214777  [mRNA]  locus=scaffold4471:169985:170977:+ [translate_table: standard]